MSHDIILDLLNQKNQITWQSIIYDLIKSEQMDPWDIDVSKLTQKYLETVKKLQEVNFFFSGKILLASALLVKIKSNKLLNEDISNLDNILFHVEEQYDELEDFYDYKERPKIIPPKLGIKTPQARRRRISVNDLVYALEKALTVNKRRIIRNREYENFNQPIIPSKKVDMTSLIKTIYEKIKNLFSSQKEVSFNHLLPEGNTSKKDKILTLYPLLHLENQSKIDMFQEKPFEEIMIKMK